MGHEIGSANVAKPALLVSPPTPILTVPAMSYLCAAIGVPGRAIDGACIAGI
ncbi:MAG: hypothetical protein KDA44_18540 [Planctomycetales bacterium]|nr:hypothetical protein [Planctomycetales bacterium]